MKQVLVLVAHADDETLGAGGYLPLLLERGHGVSVVVVSNGTFSFRGEVQNNREDAIKACKVLGVPAPCFLDFDDQKFDTYAIADIANAVASLDLKPDMVITHVASDLNKDHRIISEVAKIIGRPREKPVSIIGCEIPNTSSWNAIPFHANYYVDISSTIDKKIEAFSQYRHELQEFPHPWSPEGLRYLARVRGMEYGCQYAEAFHVIRMFDNLAL